jgi:hypothetical protein
MIRARRFPKEPCIPVERPDAPSGEPYAPQSTLEGYRQLLCQLTSFLQ